MQELRTAEFKSKINPIVWDRVRMSAFISTYHDTPDLTRAVLQRHARALVWRGELRDTAERRPLRRGLPLGQLRLLIGLLESLVEPRRRGKPNIESISLNHGYTLCWFYYG